MAWIIIELLFPILLIALPAALYKSTRPLMARFHLKMVSSGNARKLYTQGVLVLLLLYHYVYAGGHPGEWGIILSTIPCAVLFSHKRADKLIRRLHDNRRRFALTALLSVALCAVPHLHTMAIVLAFLLLAAMFYPSSRALAAWEDEQTRIRLREDPKALAEHYY